MEKNYRCKDTADNIISSAHLKKMEMDYMKAFIMENENCFHDPVNRKLLHSLWTSYCLHGHIDPSGNDYRYCIETLWNTIAENDRCEWLAESSNNNDTEQTAFLSYMRTYLV